MAQVLLSIPAMVLPQLKTSQLGTFQRSVRPTRGVVRACVLAASLLACDEPVHKNTGDASAQFEEDSRLSECSAWSDKIGDFVDAHAGCSFDADCTIVGDCSHADFVSVATSAAEAAKELVLENPCASSDGPTYNAVCKAGRCSRVRATAVCGGVPVRECPAGTSWQIPGCSTPVPSFQAGCYASCDRVGDDTSCAHGYTCQETNIDPCTPLYPSSDATCDACGSETKLCLPAPNCEVKLSIRFDGRPQYATYPPDGSTQLGLTLENLTDRALTLQFDMPCHGPNVSGLGTYDLWNECLAGACLTETVRTALTLGPKERTLWRSSVLSSTPSACNASGLPPGSYTPTFALPNVQGARVCGPAPSQLIAQPAP